MEKKAVLEGESILVLGDDLNYYVENRLAGGYLNWGLSKALFENLADPQNLITIKRALAADSPHTIIDLEGYMPQLLKHLPHLKYRREKTIYYIRED